MLNPDYRDMLSALFEEGVDFLIVGAFALAAHGLPRATGDIDIWIRCSDENAARVWRALTRFGSPTQGLTQSDLATPDVVFQIGVAPAHRFPGRRARPRHWTSAPDSEQARRGPTERFDRLGLAEGRIVA